MLSNVLPLLSNYFSFSRESVSISDLLTIEKDWGRKLRGKSLAVISNTEDDHTESWFEAPFLLSAEYLGMKYLGHVHAPHDSNGICEKSVDRLKNLNNKVRKAKMND